MAILFVGNTPLDVGLPASVVSTAATGRDAAYSPSSLLCKNQNPIIPIPVNGGTEFWVHFRKFLNNVSTGSGTVAGTIYRCFDGSGNLIFDINKSVNTISGTLRVYGSTTVSGPTYNHTTNTEYTYDLRVVVGPSGGTITVDWFINGTFFCSVSATNSGTVKTQPRSLNMELPSNLTGSATGINYSEMIVAVDESTIGMRLATLEPASAGAWAQWTGSVGSLADDDTGTGIEALAAGHRFTSIFSAYAGPSSPAGIRGVYLKALAAQSGLPPSQIDQFVRIAAINYDGALQTPSPSVPIVREMTLDPDTGLPWAVAALAALEAGFRAGT